jgi:ABC-2 type transport system permease protein
MERFYALFLPRRAAAIAVKETHHIQRDPYTMGVALGLPLLMLMFFGYAISFDVKDVKIAVLDQDHTRSSRMLVDTFRASGFFTPIPSSGDPQHDVASEHAKVALLIPSGFERTIGRGESPRVQVLLDGSDNMAAGVIMGYVSGLSQAAWKKLGPEMPAPPLALEPRFLFNGELNSRWFIVPGLLVVLIGLLSVLMTSLTVAREWEHGSMELLLSTPVKPIEIILGKLTPYMVLGLASVAMVYVAARTAFQVPFLGSHFLLGAGCLLFLFVCLSQGLLISVAARNQQVAMQISMMSGMLPAMLLSGFIYPIESMPLFFRVLTILLPPRWFIVIVRGLFLKGMSLAELAVPFTVLSIMSVGLTVLAIRRFKTDLEP